MIVPVSNGEYQVVTDVQRTKMLVDNDSCSINTFKLTYLCTVCIHVKKLFYLIEFHLMFFYMSKRIKSMTPSSLSPHYAAQSPSGRKPDLVAKEVLEWWQTNGKHPFIQPHISSPSNVGANSPENLPLGDKVQLIRLPVASPSAVKEFSQVSSEEPAHLTTG
ncbi:hypothetical protein J3Q64DRAFT_1825852 [Phycomyces blakesleeanus]|uniref:Uncharacterized protein n=1 Tax=Phycomyces blakesleeanus TaxID=4837 RepID=A0ABR3AN63_PHYBL